MLLKKWKLELKDLIFRRLAVIFIMKIWSSYIKGTSKKQECRLYNPQPKLNCANNYEHCIFWFSLGIAEAEIEGQTPKADRQYRLEAIHIRGFDGSIVSSDDIHEYFSEFSPVSFEWVDKNSANVIWALPSSAAKALLTLSRPLKEVSKI